VLKVTVSDVCVLNLVGCCLCLFRMVSQALHYLSVSHFFPIILVCQHGVLSELNIWNLIVMLFCEE
jgi:hypothetical protein